MMSTVNDDLEVTKAEYSRAAQGIRAPEIITLPAGQVIFRFASTMRLDKGTRKPTNSADWVRGAWWVTETDYQKIISRFRSGSVSLGTVARGALAVQPSWSLMDVSIKAHLLNDMKVYTGQGSTQYHDVLPNGMKMTLPGWADIKQLYLPGMRGSALSNVRVQRQKIVKSHSWGH